MAELEPVDINQCQGEVHEKEGSFMTLGPRRTKVTRCENEPVYIATEKEAGSDGQIGSMSLCKHCCGKLKEKVGEDYATLSKIKR